jgi:Bacterial TniB protein
VRRQRCEPSDAEFARFLGLPVTRRANITDIIEAVCGVCADTRTSVICVDEIHNLNIATRAGAEASDTLKYFSERIPATFVLAGINVERAGLLSGTRGEQIAGRYSMIRTSPFSCDQQWVSRQRPDAAIPGKKSSMPAPRNSRDTR